MKSYFSTWRTPRIKQWEIENLNTRIIPIIPISEEVPTYSMKELLLMKLFKRGEKCSWGFAANKFDEIFSDYQTPDAADRPRRFRRISMCLFQSLLSL